MGDKQLGPDTVNVVHEPDFKGIALGLQPAKSLQSPPRAQLRGLQPL